MGNKQARPKKSARRAATFLAALGALVMSSGVALMVAATPAHAAQSQHVPVGVCHATSSDTNPYVFIVVDDDSTKLKGHLMHRDDPNKTWKSAGTYELGGSHNAGDPKRDYIASYTGTDGVFHSLDGDITAASCDAKGDVEVPPAVADVDFTDPTCANDNQASYDTTGDHVSFEVTEGSAEPGEHIKIVATADEGYTFDDESTTQVFEHTFSDTENCDEGPRLLTPQAPSFTDPTCTTDPGVTLPTAPILSRAAASLPPSVDVNGIHYVASGDLVAGGTVTVDATLLDPKNTTFGEAQTHWSHTFTVPTGCTQVSPPTQTESQTVVKTPTTKTKSKSESAVTPTVVEAGLAGTTAQDLRGEQGLALMVAGMVMLVAAGGLGLRVRSAARI